MPKPKTKSNRSVKRFKPANSLRSPLRFLNFILIFAIIGSLFIMFSQAAPVAGFYGSIEKDQAGRINYVRNANGMASLQHIECLNYIAESWTRKMAVDKDPSSGSTYDPAGLSHNPNLAANIDKYCGKSWTMGGENVGKGANSGVIFDAFMASPGHKANILRNEFTKVGVGAYYDSAGTLWITQVFARCGNCGGKWSQEATVPTDPSSPTPPPPPPAGTPPPPTSSTCPRFPTMKTLYDLPLLPRPANPADVFAQEVYTTTERRYYYYTAGGTRWTTSFYNHSISNFANPSNITVTAHSHPSSTTHRLELDYSAPLTANPSGQYTPTIYYSNIWNYTQSLWVKRYSRSSGALLYPAAESNGGTGVTVPLTRSGTSTSTGQTTAPTMGPC